VTRPISLLASLSLLACAHEGAPPPAEAVPAPESRACETVRDDTIRACVNGYAARARDAGEEGDLALALEEVCPYAGAIAFSGCHRGAFERFRGRNREGACGDGADYIESSIEMSCMHFVGRPIERFNAFVEECFDWAERGGEAYRSRCPGRPPSDGLSL